MLASFQVTQVRGVVIDPVTFQPTVGGTIDFEISFEYLRDLETRIGQASISSESELFEGIGRQFLQAIAKMRANDDDNADL